MDIDLQTLSSQYTALLEDIDESIAAGRASIGDIWMVRAILDKLDAMVIDVLTAAATDKMDKEEGNIRRDENEI